LTKVSQLYTIVRQKVLKYQFSGALEMDAYRTFDFAYNSRIKRLNHAVKPSMTVTQKVTHRVSKNCASVIF